MPFKSAKQQRFMFSQHPQIARRWAAAYGTVQHPKGGTVAKEPGESAKAAKYEASHGGEKGESPRMAALEAVRAAHKSKPRGKPVKPRKGMGFKAAEKSIASRPGFKGDPGAILASAARNASAGAKKANPNLSKVK